MAALVADSVFVLESLSPKPSALAAMANSFYIFMWHRLLMSCVMQAKIDLETAQARWHRMYHGRLYKPWRRSNLSTIVEEPVEMSSKLVSRWVPKRRKVERADGSTAYTSSSAPPTWRYTLSEGGRVAVSESDGSLFSSDSE